MLPEAKFCPHVGSRGLRQLSGAGGNGHSTSGPAAKTREKAPELFNVDFLHLALAVTTCRSRSSACSTQAYLDVASKQFSATGMWPCMVIVPSRQDTLQADHDARGHCFHALADHKQDIGKSCRILPTQGKQRQCSMVGLLANGNAPTLNRNTTV